MTEMKKEELIQICPHCYNHTCLEKIGELANREYDFSNPHYPEWSDNKWKLFRCKSCTESVIIYESIFSGLYNHDFDGTIIYYPDIKQLYPIERSEKSIPKNINDAFFAALRTRKIDIAIYQMAIRRTLELVCVDQEAKGYTLHEKIGDLTTKGIIPKVYEKLAHLLKDLGNEGAHPQNPKEIVEDIALDHQQLDCLKDFVIALFDYLYVLPAKMNSFEAVIGKIEKVKDTKKAKRKTKPKGKAKE